MSTKKYNPLQPCLPGCDPGPPRVGPPPAVVARGHARRRHFTTQTPPASDVSALVRGALADSFNRSFEEGSLGAALFQADEWTPSQTKFVAKVVALAKANDREGIVRAFRTFGLDIFQAAALALFPELYADDVEAVGLVPETGVKRVGVDRLGAFAKLLKDVTGRGVAI